MKKLFSFLLSGAFVFGVVTATYANNIQVTNISLENLNNTNQTVMIQFDVSWENSWRVSAGPSNWDAAWLFVKYRANSGDWQHALLTGTAPNVGGATVSVVPDSVGAFLYRSGNGSGNVDYTGVQLEWDYGSGGVTESDVLDVQVFAIEMVYVPQGAFYVGGTTGSEVNKFYAGGGLSSVSYQVTSESAITVANTAGNLYYDVESGSTGGDQTGTLGADYPKGYGAFYCMKYETSQAQWVAFFNTLTAAQKANLDITGVTGKNTDAESVRNGVAWSGGSASATTTFPDVAANYIANLYVAAYLDWAGLRPMTELEYEKACRGPVAPKAGEFAWGSANIGTEAYTLSNPGQPTEWITNPAEGAGNAWYQSTYGSTSGPIRNGIFAASAVHKNREETGGSYYGIMELTGNLYERCISVGIVQGRVFTGQHGNGSLTITGSHDVAAWPVGNEGIAYRGGSYANASEYLRLSDRYDAASVLTGGNSRIGFRGVRTVF
ncbi:SUMF1/EgtB/PvdO family nonheme iron enzyme [Catalinimonas alkaloidigena]|nr:SUMF1/EgtB/PvdO family nonheme iron enzyme [Catalinimonas alkaloidigena]